MLSVEGHLVREAERTDKAWVCTSPSSGRGRRVPARVRRAVSLRLNGLDAFLAAKDRVSFQGRIRFPRNFGDPGEFDYEGFMRREGIDATMLAVKAKSGAPK